MCRCITMVLCSLMSLNAWAIGGITSDNAAPHFATGKFNETFTDLQAKVLGGTVRVTRYWQDDHWVWNRRWRDLEPVWASPDDAQPSAFRRIDQHYMRVEGDSVRYENQLIYTIDYNETADEYRWQDRRGNVIDYAVERDDNGRILRLPMVRYQDRNGITVSVQRDAEGYITTVLDHHGSPVLTYTWESASTTADKRLARVTDYTGRKVQYHYDTSDRLTGVVDVRGETYRYAYTGNGQLASFTDPKGQATTYSFNPIDEVVLARAESNGAICEHKQVRGSELKSVYNADGVGQRYGVSYNRETGRFTRRSTDATGMAREYRYNEHGEVVSKSTDGRLQYSDQVLLSDGSLNVDNLVRQYQASYGIAVVPTRLNGEPGTTCRLLDTRGGSSQLGRQSLVYVKKRTRTDSQGRKTVTEYDQFKNPVRITYPDGSRLTRSYNRYNQVLSETRPRGITTTYAYDDKGNLLTLTEAQGTAEQRITRYVYDDYGQLIQQTTGESAAGNTALAVTRWAYDTYGNLTESTDPLGHTTRYQQYDALGNPALIVDEADHEWTQTYDGAGNLLSHTNPLGQGERYTYDKAGNRDTQTAPNNATTRLTHNAAGLPLTVTDAADQTTRQEYDKANRPTAQTDANGHARYLAYDSEGRLSGLTDGLGNQTQYIYDEDRVTSIHYPTYSAQLDYDSRDRLSMSTQQADNLSRLRRFGYDPDGNPTRATDANELTTKRSYDAFNRIRTQTDAQGGLTRFTYDARDNLLQVTDPEGRITQYAYTLRDELASETKPVTGANPAATRSYAYDSRGNPVSTTNPENEQTRLIYDNANRLSEQRLFAQAGDSDPIKVIRYHYNDAAQYTGYSQAVGSAASGQTADIRAISETYIYNTLNQLTDVTVDFGAFQKTYRYTYHPNGLKKSYTNPEGITYGYHYNANNQLEAVLIPGVGQLAYSDFDWQQPRTLTLPGGNTIRYRYDALQRPLERILSDAAGTSLAQALYAYDNESNITGIQSEHGNYAFGYDNLYRLSRADYPQDAYLPSSELFGYDGVGNRTRYDSTTADATQSNTASYNARNQLTDQDNGWNYSYNANGHTTRKTYTGNAPIEGPQKVDYLYNHAERLIAVRHDDTTVAEYAYDPYGRRISKTASGRTTYYLYTDQGLAAEYNENGGLIKEYQFKPGATWSTDPLFQRTADNRIYYYQNDHLGTPQRLIAASGQVVWEARYVAFGKAEILTETISNNLRFPGQYYDVETKLHYNYFRYYEIETGRYIESDPIGLLGGLNSYLYAYGSPIIFHDPYGLRTFSPRTPRMSPRKLFDPFEFMGNIPAGAKTPRCIKRRLYGEDLIRPPYTLHRFRGYEYSLFEFQFAGLGIGLGPDFGMKRPVLKPGLGVVFNVLSKRYEVGTLETYSVVNITMHYKVFCTYEWTDECGQKKEYTHIGNEFKTEEFSSELIDTEFGIYSKDVGTYLGQNAWP